MKKKGIIILIAVVLAAVSLAAVMYFAFAKDISSCGGEAPEQSNSETAPTNPNDDGFGTEVEM